MSECPQLRTWLNEISERAERIEKGVCDSADECPVLLLSIEGDSKHYRVRERKT